MFGPQFLNFAATSAIMNHSCPSNGVTMSVAPRLFWCILGVKIARNISIIARTSQTANESYNPFS